MEVDKNEFFRQATIRICGSLNIETALENCFQYFEKILPVDEIGLYLYDPDLNVLKRIAVAKSHQGNILNPVLHLPESTKDIWSTQWAHMDDIEIINQPALRPEIIDILQMYGLDLDISIISMRLELEGKRMGVMLLRTKGIDQYTEEHTRLLLLLHEPFAIAMENALQHQEIVRFKDILADDNRYLRRQIRDISTSEIIGAKFGLRHVMDMVQQVAKLDSPVLLLGKTGVGKGVIANAIHYASRRKDGPFVSVNCGAIPDTLFDSELFGHEKGAFTGASSRKKGRFERADKGTIFLDEIGELPPQAQVRLLHVFQERVIERVGGTTTIPVDIRIISATNRNLEEMIKDGQFREDLWFRINVFPIQIPPLRQRKEDIPTLVHHFIEKKSIELKLPEKPKLASGAIDQLTAYAWPGNVRELENIVERALIQYTEGPLRFENLMLSHPSPGQITASVKNNSKFLSLDEMNSLHIQRALELANGKINGPGGAAELLNIHPNTIRKRMDKLNIQYKRRKIV
ncbi:MAG: sigma 54-interacting transcriptional regulator [Desulfobacteraceae bacterium]|nr:sigma 54-interacting transcriptional regulator [Desulfobacteraceae bacterium]MBC2754001.1 sigma 54-interacting transcriptional regulator [Desulfobacteraceae bacterium]